MNDAADYERLLDLQVLSAWTLDRQRVHTGDERDYGAARATLQAALRAQHVPGDRPWSARLRARRVEKHLRGLEAASRQAARHAEGLRTAYADHTRTLAALPEQREAKRRAKELRKAGQAAIEGATAKSLHKTATAAAAFGQEQGAGAAGGQAPAAPDAGQVRGISDLWQRGA
ncbi:hypothetical protein F0L17_26655 [Streptomyces sp. TRM43335]|uniref:Uncharacterized protein n=1 Tax=Streptomyces taklimakanensis TaxID=2569853 RepID=A0A6G2BL33_9ACTN|nr:hypothetical protein [Streptomyces taklimakanensis]